MNLINLIENNQYNYRDEDNNNIIHLIFKYNLVTSDRVKQILRVEPNLINKINNNYETPLFYIKDQYLLDWIFENIKNLDLLRVNKDGVAFINKTIDNDDLKTVKKILNKTKNISLPKESPPLIYAIKSNKDQIATYIIKNFKDSVNVLDNEYHSPLQIAVLSQNYEITQLLLDNGSDINYNGAESDENPLSMSLYLNDDKMINLLIDNKSNINTQDKNHNTIMHELFNNDINISGETVIKMLIKGDLQLKNLQGETPLDLLKNHHQNKNYNKVLKELNYDIKIEDRSFDINFIKSRESKHGLFNSDAINNILYTLIMLRKYKNLGYPYQLKFDSKVETTKYYHKLNFLKSAQGMVISDVINGYIGFSFELSPYLVMWRSENHYYIHRDLKFNLLKPLNNDKVRFILLKLTLVPSSQGTHANILLYDKKTNTMERFDPYGAIPYLKADKMDKLFEEKFREIINKPNFKYLSPSQYMGKVSFQLLSNDSSIDVKKLGDPHGYCLAWTFWYLEMRLQNPEVHPKKLVEMSVDKIKATRKKDSKNPFIDFIRNYAFELTESKNKVLKEFGIKKDQLYDLVLEPEVEHQISQKIEYEMKKIR
ncbi:MAG: hypothetical protein CMF62_01130 [Magnetococcales bacterium]|nr:hypothetical protein [Magnetococcales bacterium]|tara:strand:+ start:6139 stop:7932 length:1794 start_codon:yes stop_codon:yes gene_type:complete